VWHSAAASALGNVFKNRTILRAKRSTAMPCSALRSWSLGLPPAWADHTSIEPRRHDGRQAEPRTSGITRRTTGRNRNHAHLESRCPQRARSTTGVHTTPAPRARSTTRLRTTPAPRASARQGRHSGRSGSAICRIISRKGVSITFPGRRTEKFSGAATTRSESPPGRV